MTTPSSYTRVLLAARPESGKPIDPNTVFSVKHEPFALSPGEGQVLIKVLYASLDPAMRGWINASGSYMDPVPVGSTMRSIDLAVVVSSGPGCTLKPGDNVQGMFGWTEYAVVPEKRATKLLPPPPGAELLDYLGPLGPTGLTAYFGLKDIGQLKKGEILVVSGAAGATGSVACQIGKKWGARVFGIAGGKDKCEWLEKECGVEKAIDYKSPTFHEDVKKYIGKFDVFFDNVGGEMLDFLLTRMNRHARVIVCGGISEYNKALPAGLHSYLNLISARARMEGFLFMDYEARFPEGFTELAGMLGSGELKRKFHVVQGVENAPEALGLLYSGGNEGKLVVKIGEEGVRPRM
ncbi:alcohol dehydrogenase [Calocera viscosa TUFC12733]|uniref:Alcohol dehydrogenase n=1 Tax=Calocera viscosa (strain TUFC12733) TaxID=1330018 RepID=A0A167K7A0_CALVF|nr:alcohol dehydrogenase [Calocera viscosa TUFC12733]